jgi:hypothetical protein
VIDTVKLESPELSEEVAQAVEAVLVTRRAVDGRTGEVLYHFVSGPLVGSYDHRITCTVKRERWVSHKLPKRKENGRWCEPVVTAPESCPPYLLIEGSAHKAMLGHNLEGGSSDPRAVCSWFIDHVSSALGASLPPALTWKVRRIDVAEVYAFTYEGCESVIRGLKMAQFPRRKKIDYGSQSIMFPGVTTAVKVYHKGPEFSAHDRSRLRAVLNSTAVAVLQWRANELLRVEVEIKARKLDTDFHGPPDVGQLTEGYITDVYDRELAKMVKDAGTAPEIVRTSEAVLDRLEAHYTSGQAAPLFGTWLRFSTLGQEMTKRKMTERTYYDHCKKLKEAGVSWHGTDVALIDPGPYPVGFSFRRSDPRRVSGEDARVTALLAPYRAVA